MHKYLLKKSLLITASTLLLTSCSNISEEKVNDLEQEITNLKLENDNLKEEIEDLKYGAPTLLEKAKSQIEKTDFEEATTTLKTLISKHPDSKEAKEAQAYLTKASEEIKNRKEKAEKAEKERLANATRKLRSKHDDIQNITWFYDKSTPSYTNINNIHLYMGQFNKSNPTLRVKIQYAADDWLFIEKYIIKTDNNTYTINTSYGDVKKDNGYGGIWEWYDFSMDKTTYDIVLDMINSKNVKIRHSGSQYYKDRTVSTKEKEAMRNVLDAYEAMGGFLNF